MGAGSTPSLCLPPHFGQRPGKNAGRNLQKLCYAFDGGPGEQRQCESSANVCAIAESCLRNERPRKLGRTK